MFGDTIHQLPSVPPSSEDAEAQMRKTLSENRHRKGMETRAWVV